MEDKGIMRYSWVDGNVKEPLHGLKVRGVGAGVVSFKDADGNLVCVMPFDRSLKSALVRGWDHALCPRGYSTQSLHLKDI